MEESESGTSIVQDCAKEVQGSRQSQRQMVQCVADTRVLAPSVTTKPETSRALIDVTTKRDRWDALVRDYEMKFDRDDTSDKVRQAAVYAMVPEAVVENRLAEIRTLTRNTIDDMIRDTRETRSTINIVEAIRCRQTSIT